MSTDNGTTIDYVEIGCSDGDARILRGKDAHQFFEDMIESFGRDALFGISLRDYRWEHVHFKEEDKKCQIKRIK